MKNSVLLIILSLSLGTAQAQWLADGSNISNFQMTTINNQVIDAYQTTATGKHIIIDFSATWCSNCLSYHNSNVLEDYYQAYGTNGSSAQDAQVVFYEADFSTNNNDLNGTGTNTIADWTQGVSHAICNEAQPSDVYHKFLSAPGSIGFPSVVVLCANNNYYRISTSIRQVAALRTLILDKCGSTPLSTSSIQDINFEYDIYPNPANTQFNIDLNLNKTEPVSYTITNTFGQSIRSQNAEQLSAGLHKQSININDIPAGLYLLNVQVGERSITHKVMITH